VIEDEILIADFVQRGLESDGYHVESVFDGVVERRALGEEVDLSRRAAPYRRFGWVTGFDGCHR